MKYKRFLKIAVVTYVLISSTPKLSQICLKPDKHTIAKAIAYTEIRCSLITPRSSPTASLSL